MQAPAHGQSPPPSDNPSGPTKRSFSTFSRSSETSLAWSVPPSSTIPPSSLVSAGTPASSVPPATSSAPPVSSASNTSHHPSKRSKMSAAHDNRGTKVSPAVALVGVQSSIVHLADTMRTSFLDPMVATRMATEALFADNNLPDEHRRFMLGLLSRSNGNNAVVYTSIPDGEARRAYVKDLYDQRSG